MGYLEYMTGNVFGMESVGQVRQGDVLLSPVDSVPDGCLPITGDIVHRGEGSHTHRMTGNYQMLESKKVNKVTGEKDIYIIVTPEDAEKWREAATLVHEDHDHVILKPGIYKKEIQREFDAFESITQDRIVTRAVWD